MILLAALPLLPLAALLWFGPVRRPDRRRAGLVAALIGLFAIAVAMLADSMQIEVPYLFIGAGLVLDGVSRAALLLFGSAWIVAGLLARVRDSDVPVMPLFVALSGAMALAIAESGALVYAGLVGTGYGLYAVVATGSRSAWGSAARAYVAFLVISDLLIFEAFVHFAAHGSAAIDPTFVLLIVVALILRGSIPPAHGWLPPALCRVSAASAVLLVTVPTGAALIAALKLLSTGETGLSGAMFILAALAGASWSLAAGLAQTEAKATLGYAVAASAAVLLAAIPAAAASPGQLAWTGLTLLAGCAALPLVALQQAGVMRKLTMTLALIGHGLAAGNAALLAAPTSGRPGILAPLVAIAATALLSVAARRSPAVIRGDASTVAAILALAMAGLAIAAVAFAGVASITSAGIAAAGIGLGLAAFWLLPTQATPRIAAGDLLVPLEKIVGRMLRRLHAFCASDLSRGRDDAQRRLVNLWNSEVWAIRIATLELRLRAWSATALFLVLFALCVAFLLAR